MKKIENKAEMMCEFHKVMGVTCEQCKHNATKHKYNAAGKAASILWCELNNNTVGESYYCAEWEEKET